MKGFVAFLLVVVVKSLSKTLKLMGKPKDLQDLLQRIYYTPKHPASFSSLDSLYRAAKKESHIPVSRRDVKTWLEKQLTYTLHKPIRRRFPRNRVLVSGVDWQWESDLVDLSKLSRYNKGYKWLVTTIDVLSKYAWVVPIKDKTGKSLVQAFKKILKGGRKPVKLHTDHGTEFLNRQFQTFLKDSDIDFFTTNNETKASVVERFNRTLKTRMFKYFTYKNTRKYIDVLPQLVESYNHSYHRSIGTKPALVNKTNENKVWERLYGKGSKAPVRFRFNVGDQVRIGKNKMIFDKGYLPNWTEEIFTITERIARKPPVYRLRDFNGDLIFGTFYEYELQKIIKEDDVYRVERVLRKRTRLGQREVLVKWKGYPNEFNSWINVKDIVKQ